MITREICISERSSSMDIENTPFTSALTIDSGMAWTGKGERQKWMGYSSSP